MGPRFNELWSLFLEGFQSNPLELDCSICTFPLQASSFTLVQRLRQYGRMNSEGVLDMTISNALPNSKKSIQEIFDETQEEGGDTPTNMPVQLFTCTHKFHVGCISSVYCHGIHGVRGPICPLCRAPMRMFQDRLERKRRVPDTKTFYPVSIPF